jgi:hypothetical protein
VLEQGISPAATTPPSVSPPDIVEAASRESLLPILRIDLTSLLSEVPFLQEKNV